MTFRERAPNGDVNRAGGGEATPYSGGAKPTPRDFPAPQRSPVTEYLSYHLGSASSLI